MKLNIGENIRRLRRAADMTQEQLADKLGVAYQSVSRWENQTTYPDIEFLPALAGIFGVTVDELIGCEDSKKKEMLKKRFDEYFELCNSENPSVEEVLPMLRELRRECMTAPNMEDYLWRLFSHTAYNQNSFKQHPDILAELRIAAEDVFTRREQGLKDSVVECMSLLEDDEHIEEFLNRHATRADLTKEKLLLDRYERLDRFDKAEPLRMARLYDLLNNQILTGVLWRRTGPDHPNPRESLRLNTVRLNLLHGLCGITPDPLHPITGDGSADIFVSARVFLGFCQACYLTATGDTEGAFVALEDTVSLIETVTGMEPYTTLTCNSICFENFSLSLEKWSDRDGVLHCAGTTNLEGQLRFCFVMSDYSIHPIVASQGWEWFDPIRNDPRFQACVQRVRAAFTTADKT